MTPSRTRDLLNDPFSLFSNTNEDNGRTAIRVGVSGGEPKSGSGFIGTTGAARTVGPASSLYIAYTNLSSPNVKASIPVGVGDGSIIIPNDDVTVEVNGSRFCIVPTLFHRVESLNWVQSKSSGSINMTRNGVGSNSGAGSPVLKLDARCHPDVFEMVLKFFLYNALPDSSELSNRKASDLLALAKPLDGAQVLVQHAHFYLTSKNAGRGLGLVSGIGPSSSAAFFKRRMSTFSSMCGAKSFGGENRTGHQNQDDDVVNAANPRIVHNNDNCVIKAANPKTTPIDASSKLAGFEQSIIMSQSQLTQQIFPHVKVEPQQPAQQPVQIHSQVQSQRVVLNECNCDRSVGNHSIPSHVDMTRRKSSDHQVSDTHGPSNIGAIVRSDSNNSTIEDESISKLSHPSWGANSEDQNNENRHSNQLPIDFDTAVPPSLFASPKFSSKVTIGIDNCQPVMKVDGSFDGGKKKVSGKKKKKVQQGKGGGNNESDESTSRPKLPFQQRRISTKKFFRTVIGGGSDRNIRKMTHEECCRTSEHLL